MQKFDDVIELLLTKKANLREEIEREFAEREKQIDLLLDMAGYVPPVEEVTDEQAESDAETVAANEQPLI